MKPCPCHTSVPTHCISMPLIALLFCAPVALPCTTVALLPPQHFFHFSTDHDLVPLLHCRQFHASRMLQSRPAYTLYMYLMYKWPCWTFPIPIKYYCTGISWYICIVLNVTIEMVLCKYCLTHIRHTDCTYTVHVFLLRQCLAVYSAPIKWPSMARNWAMLYKAVSSLTSTR